MPRPSGVRGIDAYCADTRSKVAVSNASSAFASGVMALYGEPASPGLGVDSVKSAL